MDAYVIQRVCSSQGYRGTLSVTISHVLSLIPPSANTYVHIHKYMKICMYVTNMLNTQPYRDMCTLLIYLHIHGHTCVQNSNLSSKLSNTKKVHDINNK
jgi:hypothetical protein